MAQGAFGYVAAGENAVETVVTGWILLLIHQLIVPLVPLVFVVGYLVRVLDSTGTEGSAPTFKGLRELARDGVFGSLLLVIYGIVPGAVLFVGGWILIEWEPPAEPGFPTAMILFMLGLILLFSAMFYLYIAPLTLRSYAEKRSFRSGFDFENIVAVGLNVHYLYRWMYGFVVLVVGIAVVRILAAVPTAGPFFAPLVAFVVIVVTVAVWDRAFETEW